MAILRDWAEQKYGKDKVSSKLEEIIEAAKTDNAKTLKIQMITISTVKRLGQLASNDQNIEYINIASSLVENGIRRLILSYDFVVNGILALSDFDAPLKIKTHIQNDNNALGSLINELHRFSDNEKLFGLLGNFNGNKIKAGHKMFEEETDIEKVNAELRNYVSAGPIAAIHNEMVREHESLQLRLIDRIKEFGLIPKGPADLEDAAWRLKEMQNKK